MMNSFFLTSFKIKNQRVSFPGFTLFLFVYSFFISCVVYAQKDPELPAIDFSYAGYHSGEIPIPSPPAIISVKPSGGDDSQLLQAAINYMAHQPIQENGFRGAILLAPGIFRVSKPLHLSVNGVVLRGSGNKKTTIVATGHDRYTLLNVGREDSPTTANQFQIDEEVVSAGSMTLKLKSVQGLRKGDRLVITRPSTQEWITSLGMDTISGTFPELRFHWPEGSRNLIWDRKITTVDKHKNQITLDAPITTALDKKYGSGIIEKVVSNHPLQKIGIENLIIESEFNKAKPKDEEHAWFGITLNNIEDAWVRNITARHFVSSAVKAGPRARRITVQNCRSEQPISEVGGYRRLSFLIEGQQVLVEDCTSDSGVNDFAIGFMASGPNVFLNCTTTNALGASGSYESWASGVLYENVRIEANDLRLTYDMRRAQAGGWTAANSVIWNCTANEIVAKGPDDAPVVIVTSPESLYRNQLINRIGNEAKFDQNNLEKSNVNRNIKEFTVEEIPPGNSNSGKENIPLKIINGRFVTGETIAWGGSVNDAWWLGQTSPANALDAGISITRFVPGRKGPGLTEDLSELADRMVARKIPFYQSGPAIWYDRRRDDHSITKRADGNVWAAFYELPWARSGKGTAWDGLSKYDLSTYNPWYFNRIKSFASLADINGIILYHHLYNNHNLLETASHWIDSPWRPANNINDTVLPEPPPIEPGTKVHLANQFYNVENPALRELHRSYILHVLDQLGSFENVIFGLSFQYSGPASFQRFFQSTVAEWEKKNNKKIRLVIDTGKNVTDEILADPEFADQISVIDMRYWHYLPDGSLWAPDAGQNKAFRELHPREFGDPTTPEQIYRQVREYHEKYPEKAIVSWHSGVNPVPALMAGGAQVLMRNPTAGHGQGRNPDYHPLDGFVKKYLSKDLMYMQPKDEVLQNEDQNWLLANDQHSKLLIYSLSGPKITFVQNLKNTKFSGIWFNPETGTTKDANIPKKIKKEITLEKPSEEAWLLLLTCIQ